MVSPEFGVIHGDDGPLLREITQNWEFSHLFTSGRIPPRQWKSLRCEYWTGIRQSTQRNRLSRQGSQSADFLRILTYTYLPQIGMITMDNASNNNTMMQEIADELRVMGIPFDVDALDIPTKLQDSRPNVYYSVVSLMSLISLSRTASNILRNRASLIPKSPQPTLCLKLPRHSEMMWSIGKL